MKLRASIILLLALILMGSTISHNASAGISKPSVETRHRPKFLSATGQEFFVGVIDPGEISCPGGPCGPGSRMKIRGRVSEYNYVLEGPAAGLFGPSATATLNCNLDENMTGPCWGTFEWPASDEERWEGIWYGPFNLATFAGSYKAAGHGHGGRLDGLKLKIDAEYPGDRPYPYGNVSLMVFDPHGRHPGR